MTAKAILKARPGTFRFSDRVIDLEVKTDTTLKNSMTNRQVPCKIGRAFKNDKSESTNGFFDCKVCIIWVKNCLLAFAIWFQLIVSIVWRCSRRPTLFFSLTTINLSSWTLEGGVLHKSRNGQWFNCVDLTANLLYHYRLIPDNNLQPKYADWWTISSSNGTFVNNVRLSRAGQESGLTEVFTGDIIRSCQLHLQRWWQPMTKKGGESIHGAQNF